MTQSQNSDRTWAESLESAARYFTHTVGGAFRFAVTNDELVQRRFNTELQQVLRGKETPVQIHDWSKASPPDMYPAEQLRRLKAAHPEMKGIICIGLERAMRDSPEMLTMLNFAREALSEVGVPILFWISFRTLPLMSRFAIDLYNQRIGANLYFEHDAESADTDGSAMRFIAHETVQANRDLRPLEARLKLLEKQFDELKKIESPEKLANDIVLELLKVYVKIPGMSRMVQSLIDEYGGLIDLEKPENCNALAYGYDVLGDSQNAERFFGKALDLLRPLTVENPSAWGHYFAATLFNLATQQRQRNELNKAENGFREALGVYRELADTNPRLYFPDMAYTLNGLANLQRDRNELIDAERGYREALAIYLDLENKFQIPHRSHVAGVLNNLAVLHRIRNEYSEAEKKYEEALEIYQDLAKSNPQVYLPEVAMILNNMANLQCHMSEYSNAVKNYQESLEIYRELVSGNLRYVPELARTLINLAVLFQSDLPDRQKSLTSIEEALFILLPLNERLPYTRSSFDRAVQVVKNWGLDPDEFLANLNIPHPKNPADDSSSAEHE